MSGAPFDPAKAFTDFWSNGMQAVMRAQEEAGRAFSDGLQAMAAGKLPGMPALPADFPASADLTKAGQSVMDLWSAAGTLSGSLAAKLPGVSDNETVDATFRKMIDPRAWLRASGGEMEEVLGRMADGPRLADLFDVERRYARVMQAWVEMRRRALEHQAVVLEAWLRAGNTFLQDLSARTSSEGKAPDAKATLSLWTETANRELLDTQRSDAFLGTQTAVLRASTELRVAQQDLVEHYGKQFGFPTRVELDDVHRTVTELRRELRAMKREQQQAKGQGKPNRTRPAGQPPASQPARN